MPTICSLKSIHLYPMKSCAPLSCVQAEVEARGLRHDRRWMVADADGNALTGRECARLTLIRASCEADGSLRLDAPGMATLVVKAHHEGHRRVTTSVWGTAVSPTESDPKAHIWLSAFLGQPVRLLHMDEHCVRPLDPAYAKAGDVVSLADSFPLLLISQESVDLLNTKLAAPVPMLQFRPNLVTAGLGPHAEDGWKWIRIGSAEFEVAKPRTLCVFANVDFEHGERNTAGEPLRTLATYRRSGRGLTFGQKLIPRTLGIVRTGDTVEVIA